MRKLITVLPLLFASPLFASHPLATDDVGTVAPQMIEIEMGYDNCKDEVDSRSHTTALSIKHGLSEIMDIGVSIPYTIAPSMPEKFGKAGWGVKFHLIKEVFAFSVNNEMGSKEYFVNGIISRSWGQTGAHFNAGYQSSGDSDIPGAMVYRVAVTHDLAIIDVVAEFSHDGNNFSDGLAGMRYKIDGIGFVAVAAGKDFKGSADKLSFGFHTEF